MTTPPNRISKHGQFSPAGRVAFAASLARRVPRGRIGFRLCRAARRFAWGAVDGPQDTTVEGVRFRLYPLDNRSERSLLFQPRFFDPVERAAIVRTIRQGGVFIDAGANAGGYALTVARAVPAARVIAVEPDPVMMRRLRANLDLNPDLKVELAPFALSGHAGGAVLRTDSGNRGENSLLRGDGPGIKVETETLLTCLDRFGVERPDALKMDLEGAEAEVLEAFLATTPRRRWPRLLVLETHRSDEAAVRLATGAGYGILARTRMNIVLSLEVARGGELLDPQEADHG